MVKRLNLVNDIFLADIILIISLLIDVLIRPESLANNSGISYFGIFLNTLPAYVAGLSMSSYIIARFAFLKIKKYRVVRVMLIALFPFNLFLITFPYDVNRFYADVHQTFGVLIFVFELLISLYISEKLGKIFFNRLLLSIELISGLFSAYYLAPKNGFLMQAQIIYQIAFGLMLLVNYQQLQNKATNLTK